MNPEPYGNKEQLIPESNFAELDQLVELKVHEVMQKTIKVMLRKLDQFMHGHLKKFKQEHQSLSKKTEQRIDDSEVRMLEKLYDHRR